MWCSTAAPQSPRTRPDVERTTLQPRSPLAPGYSVALSAGVRRIVAPNAGLMTGRARILTSWARATLQSSIRARRPRALASHSGGLRRRPAVGDRHAYAPRSFAARGALAAQTGAQLIGLPPPADGRQDAGFQPQYRPGDGERLLLGTVALTAIHTPGMRRTACATCWTTSACYFTGDHVLQGVSPVILPPDGDMSEYLQSLAKLAAYDFERIRAGDTARCWRTAKRRSNRCARTGWRARTRFCAALEALGAATLDRLTSAVYDDVPRDRHSWAKLTLEAHPHQTCPRTAGSANARAAGKVGPVSAVRASAGRA